MRKVDFHQKGDRAQIIEPKAIEKDFMSILNFSDFLLGEKQLQQFEDFMMKQKVNNI